MFRKNVPLDPSQVGDRRGRSSLGPIAGLGGGAGIILLLASLFLGVDLTQLVSTSQPVITDETGGSLDECRTGADANESEDCRIVGFVNSIQSYWSEAFDRLNRTYEGGRFALA